MRRAKRSIPRNSRKPRRFVRLTRFALSASLIAAALGSDRFETPLADPISTIAALTAPTPVVADDSTRDLQVVPANGVRRALLIGVDDYARFGDLKYAVADVELLREKLVDLGFKPENIVALKSRAELAFQPTKANIEERLDALLAESKSDDVIFVAFSGHGFEADGFTGFAPQDARPSGDARVVLPESTISLSDVMKRLESSESRFKWLIVDACRENLTTDGTKGASAKALTPLDPPPGLILLQSCKKFEFSREDDETKHGVFTSKLAEALDGAGDEDRDGVMSILDVVKYATRETSKAVAERFGATQTPYSSGEFTDFVLADDLNVDGLPPKERAQGAEAVAAAIELATAKKFDAALAKLDKALALKPTGDTLASWKAKREEIERAKSAQDALDAANAHLDKANAKLEAANAELEATNAFHEKRYEEAETAIDRAIKLESTPTRTALKTKIDAARSATNIDEGIKYFNAKEYEKAVECWRRAAEQGNMIAQHNLGCCYRDGTGVEQDYEAAFQWFEKAAEQNYPDALRELAKRYREGRGVDKDEAKAAEYERRAETAGK